MQVRHQWLIFAIYFCVFSHEIDIIRKKSGVLSGVAGLEYTLAPMASLVSVITLVLTGQPITPASVSMLLSFMNVLRLCTIFYVGYGFLEIYEAFVSLGRIEDFLLLEDMSGKSLDQTTDDTSDKKSSLRNMKRGFVDQHTEENMQNVSNDDKIKDLDKPTTLLVSRLTFKQINREDEFIMREVGFTSSLQSLTVITGPVGSGKSTLLSAIAGEVSDTSGTINCKGNVVYVPQTAWVFSGTIKENILFGKPYDEFKYTQVIEACALTEDLKQFPDCDQTVVGERGEVLSGGQRARVSLARAVYAGEDVYLLDDPLSAVDFKVGKQIFEKCIKGLLGNKTRVLISHQEQHMKEADQVIVLYKGHVLAKGTFNELLDKGFINTSVDPLYEKASMDKHEKSFAWENEEESEVADNCDRMMSLANEVKGLQVSQEDRTIGQITAMLYWNYFRSGLHWLAIFAVICLCLVTQGKPQFSFLLSMISRSSKKVDTSLIHK